MAEYGTAVYGTSTYSPPDQPVVKPSLDLAVEITQPDGRTFIWDSTAVAGSIPTGVTFRTRRGDGFADGSVTLSRRIDQDYPDLHLFDSVAFVAADGSVAYEGRLGAAPRSMGDTHSITCQLAGWMSHAKDRKFTEIYVDRDLRRWGPPSRARKVALLDASFRIYDAGMSPDAGGASVIIATVSDTWDFPYKPISEALYDAGPNLKIAGIHYDVAFVGGGYTGDWDARVYISAGETLDAPRAETADLSDTAAASGYLDSSAIDDARYASVFYIFHTNSGTTGGTAGKERHAHWKLAVYGDHGLTLRGTDPKGVSASDAIKHIASKYAPKLNTSGVQATSYPIPHLAFHEHVFPYDAFLDINKHHLWELAVWENRTLHYGPHDVTDYDWEVRLSDHGVTVDLQGDSVEDLANGILVSYPDIAKGTQHTLEPTDHAELRDDDPLNPANRAALDKWTEVKLSSPSTQDAALQIGRTILAEYNQPKAPGTINVRGHIRDRAGNWQQAWKVRAGDTVAITDHPNSRPRLIMETTYNHDRHDLTIAVDATMRRTDAILDRLSTALAAANL